MLKVIDQQIAELKVKFLTALLKITTTVQKWLQLKRYSLKNASCDVDHSISNERGVILH